MIDFCQLVVWTTVRIRLQEVHTSVGLARQNVVLARIGGCRNLKPTGMHVIRTQIEEEAYPLLKIETHVAGVWEIILFCQTKN